MSLEGKTGPPPTTFTGTDPAAGAESIETVPATEAWDVSHYEITLVADATAISRDVDIIIDDGTNEFMRFIFNTSITQSQTVKIQIGYFGKDTAPADTATTHYHVLPMARIIEMGPSWRIRTLSVNLQSGDNFGAPIIIRKRWKA